MVVEGFLSAEQAQAAKAEPLATSPVRRIENPAPYFVENVRRWLQNTYGSSSLYKEGFEVRTTVDPRLQIAANIAVDRGLRSLDKRQGWRGVSDRVPEDEDPDTFEAPSWRLGQQAGKVVDAVVTAVDKRGLSLRLGRYSAELTPEDFAWTELTRPSEVAQRGDLLRVHVESLDDEQNVAEVTLEQEPAVEAALVAIEPSTGAIRALVGGFDFERSEFDRVTQARRQTGSAFKPIVFAAALDQGWTLGDTILDEPTVFLSRRSPDPYQPENYTNQYYGSITLRTALEQSANIATVKLAHSIGYDAVIDTARRLGIRSDLQPFPSLALGAFEVSLIDLTSAYGTLANQGVLVEPHLVEEVYNREGALVQRLEPAVRDAVSPQIAYLMNRVLEGVVTDGTGRAAKGLGDNVAGKTGTTDNNTDAWFVGYTRDLAVGVWVGFDEPKSLGSLETGALAALPIWREFMERAIEVHPLREFPVPPGISIVTIDRETGLRSDRRAGCSHLITEVFLRGTEPTAYCTVHHHDLLQFPYPFQRFELNERGELMIPDDRLGRILDQETSVFLIDNGRRLETRTETGVYSLALRILPPEGREPLPDWVAERFDTAEWNGLDGRVAEVIWLRR
jgi:penicillin-binding protein 1A